MFSSVKAPRRDITSRFRSAPRHQTVEVTAEATALIAESSSTIGNILTEKNVRDLPLVSNNVLDLMQTMAGVRGTDLTENHDFRRRQHRQWSIPSAMG